MVPGALHAELNHIAISIARRKTGDITGWDAKALATGLNQVITYERCIRISLTMLSFFLGSVIHIVLVVDWSLQRKGRANVVEGAVY